MPGEISLVDVPSPRTTVFRIGPGRIVDGRRMRELAILGRAADLEAVALPDEWQDVGLAALCPVTGEVDPALAAAFPEASTVALRLRLDSGSFTLEIEDDGRGLGGLDPKEAAARNGLRNMRKRMEDIGGSFWIGPATERGAVVRLTAPLSQSAG